MRILNFNIDYKIDSYDHANKITKFIDDFINQGNNNNLILYIAKNTGLPAEVVSFEFKQFLIRNYSFATGKFSKKFEIYKIFKSIFVYISTLFWILLFSKNKLSNSYDLIIDEIEREEEAYRFLGLTKEFKSNIFISKTALSDKYNHLKFNRYKGCKRSFVFKNFFTYLFGIFFQTLKYSFFCRTNLLIIVLHILKKIIKYESLFSQIKAKFLIQERSYTTSAIKNFLFKKNGGINTSCIQKNIIPIRNDGFYINVDYFFSLGNKTTVPLSFTGAKIKKIIPVGSIFLESRWFNTKKIEVPYFDLLVICGNAKAHITHHTYLNDYYEHFKWIAKLSKKYPELKIGLKHPAQKYKLKGFKLKNEDITKIFDNTNAIQIIDNLGHENYSYGYAYNAKLLCGWNSVMAYEMLGHQKPFLLLDPGKRNIGFLHKDNFNQKWRFGTFEEFEKVVKKIIISKEEVKVDNSQDFCLESKNVSKKISYYLREIV